MARSSTRICTRNADAELLHSKAQRGATHDKEDCGPVRATNLSDCLLDSGDDFCRSAFPRVARRLRL
jgi:hypothetical protein